VDINIIAGKNSEKNNKHIFSLIKNRDKTKRHIIIAPDRSLFSLERRLFDETGEQCFFDVSVTSISKLSKTLLKQDKNILTKQSGVALVKKLLIDNKDKLCAFKKSTSYMGFANTLFETICLYKSCNISCNDVYVDDSQSHSNLKQKDIKLIYTEYEKFLQNDFTDSFNQLILFSTLINKDFCNNTIFYFVEFDDFTSLMYSVIEKLSRYSEKFYICATYGKGNNNSNIYSNKVYYDLISLFKSQGLEYKINHLEDNSRTLENILVNNLLSYNKIEKFVGDNDKIYVNSFESVSDEIRYTIAEIYSKVLNDSNLTFSDFAIVLPNLDDYITLLKSELKKYQIPYFVDKNDILIEHVLIRNLFDCFKMILGDFTLSDFTNLLKSELLNFDLSAINDLDNTLHKIGARGYECLNTKHTSDSEVIEFENLILNLRNTSKEISSCKCFLEKVVLEVYNYLIKKLDIYLQKINSLDNRIFNQVIGKFEDINKDFLSVFNSIECSFEDFVETYYSYFESTNISLPPITSNTLFIADFNSSYLSTYEHMYIFGCNEGVLPKFKLDNGLVTDEEIQKLPNADKINPTIAMLNNRKTFKLFDILFKGNYLTLSFLTANSKGKLYPNNLILSLIQILDIDIKNASTILDLINNSFNELNIDNVIFNNLTPQVATINILMLVKNWETYKNNANYRALVSTLFNANYSNSLDCLINDSHEYENIGQVNLFKNNFTSVSQIESYYSCPYLHFSRYGLRLNKKQEYKLQPNDIGTIMHAVLKKLIPFIMKNLEDTNEIILKGKTYLKELLQTENYAIIVNNPTNAYIIKSLYNELERVCVALVNEIKCSDFKPNFKYLEYNFQYDRPSGVKIRGSIDRVDTSGDNFIVIDYKTGDNSFDNYNQVYSGKKLQLLVYAKAFEEEFHKNLKGVYYFPLSNAFSKDEVNYRFNGVTYKSKENILAIDNNLANCNYKSKILNLTTGKSGDFYKSSYYDNLCLENDELKYLLDFAIKQVDKAIDNIRMGDIKPHPIRQGQKIVCKYCDFKGLCNYLGDNEKLEVAVPSINDLKQKEEKDGGRT